MWDGSPLGAGNPAEERIFALRAMSAVRPSSTGSLRPIPGLSEARDPSSRRPVRLPRSAVLRRPDPTQGLGAAQAFSRLVMLLQANS